MWVRTWSSSRLTSAILLLNSSNSSFTCFISPSSLTSSLFHCTSNSVLGIVKSFTILLLTNSTPFWCSSNAFLALRSSRTLSLYSLSSISSTSSILCNSSSSSAIFSLVSSFLFKARLYSFHFLFLATASLTSISGFSGQTTSGNFIVKNFSNSFISLALLSGTVVLFTVIAASFLSSLALLIMLSITSTPASSSTFLCKAVAP